MSRRGSRGMSPAGHANRCLRSHSSFEVPMVHAFPSSRALWLAPPALILAACHDMGPSRSLSLSVTAKSAATASLPAAPGLNADIIIGSGANSLRITAVQVVLSEIELSTGGTCSPTDEHDGC